MLVDPVHGLYVVSSMVAIFQLNLRSATVQIECRVPLFHKQIKHEHVIPVCSKAIAFCDQMLIQRQIENWFWYQASKCL